MSLQPLYDRVGHGYSATRRTDPQIAQAIWRPLGDTRTVLNAGAGTGSYEPPDRDVTAVEPSAVMRAQRPAEAALCIDAYAEALPFEDRSFDAAMAVLSDHHWPDPIAGLRETQRVSKLVVVFQATTSRARASGWSATTRRPTCEPAHRSGPGSLTPSKRERQRLEARPRLTTAAPTEREAPRTARDALSALYQLVTQASQANPAAITNAMRQQRCS